MKKVFALFAFLIAGTLALGSLELVYPGIDILAIAVGLFVLGTIGLSAALGVVLWRGEK